MPTGLETGGKRALRQAVEQYGADTVIHLAARCSVDESVREPGLYYDHNLRRPLAMLEILISYGVRRFVLSSSAAVYGEPRQLPISEEHPTEPLTLYGRTKRIFEQVAGR